MTPQKLQELRNQTEERLNNKLTIAKIAEAKGLTNLAYYDIRLLMLTGTEKYVSINDNELDVMDKLNTLMKQYKHSKGIGLYTKMSGVTRVLGRSDYFDHVKFHIRHYNIHTEVPEVLISELTKKALVSIVKPKDWGDNNNFKTFTLDCSLMTLFNEGELTMSKVIELSNADCIL